MYDVIVYGASGITAKYVIDRLEKTSLNFAVAGRDKSRILKNVKGTHPVIQASVSEIDQVTRNTRVLINCAGPYIHSGEAIVESCIRNGTHYFDVTGETFFIEEIIAKHHKAALEKGIYIVNCAGFDSIPADLGVETVKGNVDLTGKDLYSLLRLNNFCINFGTYESLVNSFANVGKMRQLRTKNKKPRSGTKLRKYFYSPVTNSYWVVFMGTDVSVVRRTQSALSEKGISKPARYFAYLDTGSLPQFLVFMIFFYITFFLSRFSLGRRLLLTFPGFFTVGWVHKNRPPEDSIRKSNFSMEFFTAERGEYKKMSRVMRISGPDPGTATTPVCLVEAVKLFLEMNDKNEKKFKGGVLTPGMVFYDTDLTKRLSDQGVVFDFEMNKKGE